MSLIPSRKLILCRHPKLCITDTSSNLRGAPSGLVVSNTSSPSNSTTERTVSANSRIVTSSPVPRFTKHGLGKPLGSGLTLCHSPGQLTENFYFRQLSLVMGVLLAADAVRYHFCVLPILGKQHQPSCVMWQSHLLQH